MKLYFSVYPYERKNYLEVLRLGFLKVLRGDNLGRSCSPVKISEFENPLFSKEELASIRARITFWFPFVSEVVSFEVTGQDTDLGFKARLKLDDDSVVEVK